MENVGEDQLNSFSLQSQNFFGFLDKDLLKCSVKPNRSGRYRIYVLVLNVLWRNWAHILYKECLFVTKYVPEKDCIALTVLLNFMLIYLMEFCRS